MTGLLRRLARRLRRLSPRTRAMLAHDLSLFVALFLATDVLSSDHLTLSLLLSAGVTAFKATVRLLLPIPPKP